MYKTKRFLRMKSYMSWVEEQDPKHVEIVNVVMQKGNIGDGSWVVVTYKEF